MTRAILLFASLAMLAFGQVSSATLAGEVRDSSMSLISGVKITATNDATGFTRIVRSSATGHYTLPELRPGSYSLTAAHPGFRESILTGVNLGANQKAQVDFVLQLGVERESVTVTAQLAEAQTSDASMGYRLQAATITNLPLVGRNPISLVTLGPGAIPRQLSGFVHDQITDIQPARGAVAFNPSVNGARPTMNTYVLDGAYNTDVNAFVIAVTPPMESVQEFRTQSSVGSAEFAQAGGAIVDVVTKSGTRQLHGNAFEFLRNEAIDARNYFDTPSLPRPIFRQSQFGGSLGGPLPLRSTFFFATYEGLRGKSAKSTVHLLPAASLRSGDFAGRAPIFDPLSFDPATGTRRPFPNNRIPAARLDPIAQRFLQLYEPLPNLNGGGFGNYLDATPNEDRNDGASVRIDRQFSSGSTIFGRYTINDNRARLGGNFPERAFREDLRAQQAAFGHTLARGAGLNEARFTFTRLRVFDLAESAFGTDVIRDLGIGSGATDPASYGLPYFVVNNFETVTDATRLPQTQNDRTWSVADSFTRALGKHTFKAGAQWMSFGLDYLQSAFPRGRYVFTGAFTSDPNRPGVTGDALADFLLGVAQSTRRTAGTAQAYLRQNSFGSYIQDDWRLHRRLTVTFGMRYDYTAPFRDARGQMLNLDYSTLPRAPLLRSVDRGAEPDRNNFAPRIGIAWRAPGLPGVRETVVRSGYGIYHTPEIALESYDLVRNSTRSEINETTGPIPSLTLRDGFPSSASSGFPSYYGLDPRARTPYLQQWNFGVQQEFAGGFVFETAYVGSKGTKLGRFRTFNTPLHVETGENLDPRPGELQSLRTFPQLGPIYQRQHIANSSYHSLQLKGEKRFTGRVSILASFVWSKAIDDADTLIPGLSQSFGAQDERNLRLEKGLSVNDVRRRLSAGFLYSIPSPRLLKIVLGNWIASGIMTFQDGSPWNPVYFGSDFANSGTPNRPNVVAGQDVPLPSSQRSAETWFNTAAFSTPKPLTFGNAGRNILPSPGVAVADLGLQRRFAIRERGLLQFRGEVFNFLNHPNWGIPGQYPDFGPFFGRIFATGEPRRFQLALRAEF